ncbi:hypothetical protein F4803DRAFT_227711 [Xylaria telfairii]|nr:hypothetical protein F4803DRAFT_227711 [Xylaria telfairii]
MDDIVVQARKTAMYVMLICRQASSQLCHTKRNTRALYICRSRGDREYPVSSYLANELPGEYDEESLEEGKTSLLKPGEAKLYAPPIMRLGLVRPSHLSYRLHPAISLAPIRTHLAAYSQCGDSLQTLESARIGPPVKPRYEEKSTLRIETGVEKQTSVHNQMLVASSELHEVFLPQDDVYAGSRQGSMDSSVCLAYKAPGFEVPGGCLSCRFDANILACRRRTSRRSQDFVGLCPVTSAEILCHANVGSRLCSM